MMLAGKARLRAAPRNRRAPLLLDLRRLLEFCFLHALVPFGASLGRDANDSQVAQFFRPHLFLPHLVVFWLGDAFRVTELRNGQAALALGNPVGELSLLIIASSYDCGSWSSA